MIKVEGNDVEFSLLSQMIDMAVKHSGIGVAEVALHWTRKISEAIKAAKEADGDSPKNV
jgi:hypothetical protein